MLDQTLRLFGIVPDYDLDIMAEDQSRTQVAAAVDAGADVQKGNRPNRKDIERIKSPSVSPSPLLAYWLWFQPEVILYERQKKAHGKSRWTF
jgi:hypothetical protein